MVETHGHAVGVVASDDKVLTFRLDFEAVDGVGKSFKDNFLGIFGNHAVHQSAHGDDLGVGFLFRAAEAQHEAQEGEKV